MPAESIRQQLSPSVSQCYAELHGEGNIVSLLSFIHINSAQTGVNIFDFPNHFNLRTQIGLNTICCILGSVPESQFGDLWLTRQYILLAFGFDNVTLSCAGPNAAFVPKPNNFCNLAPNYNFNTGLKALISTPGAPAYTGANRLLDRYTESSSNQDPAQCANTRCNGRGSCNQDGISCTCNAGSWGPLCQFSKLLNRESADYEFNHPIKKPMLIVQQSEHF
jgi:hypothetical protein